MPGGMSSLGLRFAIRVKQARYDSCGEDSSRYDSSCIIDTLVGHRVYSQTILETNAGIPHEEDAMRACHEDAFTRIAYIVRSQRGVLSKLRHAVHTNAGTPSF